MIAKDEMMGVLLKACPSFAPQWETFQDEWREEGDLPLYLVLADLGRHIIGMLERDDRAELPGIFAAIEELQTRGEHYVQEAATFGLLEALQNRNLHLNGTEAEQFRAYLGPESARNWDTL